MGIGVFAQGEKTMKNNTLITAKTFFRMAETDRKLLVVSGAINSILTVSLIIKLSVANTNFWINSLYSFASFVFDFFNNLLSATMLFFQLLQNH